MIRPSVAETLTISRDPRRRPRSGWMPHCWRCHSTDSTSSATRGDCPGSPLGSQLRRQLPPRGGICRLHRQRPHRRRRSQCDNWWMIQYWDDDRRRSERSEALAAIAARDGSAARYPGGPPGSDRSPPPRSLQGRRPSRSRATSCPPSSGRRGRSQPGNRCTRSPTPAPRLTATPMPSSSAAADLAWAIAKETSVRRRARFIAATTRRVHR